MSATLHPLGEMNLYCQPIENKDSWGGNLLVAQYRGEVRWFNNAKGFGFLGHPDGPDVFVHYTSTQSDGYKSLKEGDPVEFDIIQGNTGRPQADKVVAVKKV